LSWRDKVQLCHDDIKFSFVMHGEIKFSFVMAI
jgi:hypothetical protein